MRSRRLTLALLAAALAVAGCGAAEREARPTDGTTVRGHGLRVVLPSGWHGEIVRPDPPGALTLRAANFPLPPPTDVGQEAQREMAESDVLITLAHYGRAPSGARDTTLPLAVGRGDFAPFEGFARPVATKSFALGGRAFQLWVVFAGGDPRDDLLGEANRVLAAIALEPRRLAIDDLAVELPVGWDGFAKRLDATGESAAVYAANTRWPDVGQNVESAELRELFRRLPRDGVVVSAVAGRTGVDPAARPLEPPIRLEDGYFLADSYEGQPAPHVSTQLISGRVGDRFLTVQVFFGRNDPDEAMRAEAGEVLATLTVRTQPPAPLPVGWRRHRDDRLGVRATIPDDWHVADRPLTNIADPREVLALATYPLRGGEHGGGPCVGLRRALADMPPDGALLWLLEYRPARGDVWADLPRDRFPPRPRRWELARGELQAGLCGAGFGVSTTFRDADRPFQLWLLFGEDVSDARLAETAQILGGLVFDDLPAPPPDPYAGWPLISTSPGDSLRPPPGWAAAAAAFPPATTPRPRPLFFASNRPLFGLPRTLVPHVESLPGPMPEAALANAFPRDGVLLWVLEESERRPIAQGFEPIGRGWPRAADFTPTEILTKPAPDVRWLHAAGEWRGYRFSVWIAAGRGASDEDRRLALKSAASLAVSGCWRDATNDCPNG